jgi:anti-sigma B factor antagonist
MAATPASHPFEIREHDAGGVHVITMRGELDLATAPRLCVRIDAARHAGSRRILVDLTTAEFCDSAGLRALVGSYRELAAHGRRMAVAALEDSAVGRLFSLAGADELLEIHKDSGTALAALAPSAS